VGRVLDSHVAVEHGRPRGARLALLVACLVGLVVPSHALGSARAAQVANDDDRWEVEIGRRIVALERAWLASDDGRRERVARAGVDGSIDDLLSLSFEERADFAQHLDEARRSLGRSDGRASKLEASVDRLGFDVGPRVVEFASATVGVQVWELDPTAASEPRVIDWSLHVHGPDADSVIPFDGRAAVVPLSSDAPGVHTLHVRAQIGSDRVERCLGTVETVPALEGRLRALQQAYLDGAPRNADGTRYLSPAGRWATVARARDLVGATARHFDADLVDSANHVLAELEELATASPERARALLARPGRRWIATRYGGKYHSRAWVSIPDVAAGRPLPLLLVEPGIHHTGDHFIETPTCAMLEVFTRAMGWVLVVGDTSLGPRDAVNSVAPYLDVDPTRVFQFAHGVFADDLARASGCRAVAVLDPSRILERPAIVERWRFRTPSLIVTSARRSEAAGRLEFVVEERRNARIRPRFVNCARADHVLLPLTSLFDVLAFLRGFDAPMVGD
jgi:hypothetical protein